MLNGVFLDLQVVIHLCDTFVKVFFVHTYATMPPANGLAYRSAEETIGRICDGYENTGFHLDRRRLWSQN